MKHLLTLNLEDSTKEEVATYAIRRAARAVVFDADGKVALLHATKNGYYKLPGGGIEGGEAPVDALVRECREEIGCEIEVLSELGEIIEYKKKDNLKQISYAYVARVVGEKGTPHLETGEEAEGFQTAWFPFEEAQKVITECPRVFYPAEYMVARDARFLDEAKEEAESM